MSTKWSTVIFPRRILLLVTGLSPQVVTETIYASSYNKPRDEVPTEVHVITTQKGNELLVDSLIVGGWYAKLIQDYALPPIAFDESHIYTVQDATGNDLNDIRTEADNEAVANTLAKYIGKFTSDPNCSLHLSIAGGRKTMGFLAGYVLTLFGRSQDKLSHVLVSEGYESQSDFYYPTLCSQLFRTKNGTRLDAKDAKVGLANIPFVRLSSYLSKVVKQEPDFFKLVAFAQAELDEPELILDEDSHQLKCGGHVISLPPAQFALYYWLAKRLQNNELEVTCPYDKEHPDKELGASFLEATTNIIGPSLYYRIKKNGLEHRQFTEWRSKAFKRLTQQLGAQMAHHYRIDKNMTKGTYGLHGLKKDQIHFAKV